MFKLWGQCSAIERVQAVLGALLVVSGLAVLVARSMRLYWWNVMVGRLGMWFGLVSAVSLVCLMVLLVWARRTGRLAGFGARPEPLIASSDDKRYLGVCGGIAEHWGLGSTLVRGMVVLLFFAQPVATAVAYLLLALAFRVGGSGQ